MAPSPLEILTFLAANACWGVIGLSCAQASGTVQPGNSIALVKIKVKEYKQTEKAHMACLSELVN